MENRWSWVIGGVVAVVAAVWWFNNQSGAVAMNDGTYDCQVVAVGTDGKYQVVTSDGQNFEGYIEVEGGEVVSLSSPQQVLGWSDSPNLSYENKGRTHVKVTDRETYLDTKFAFACDHRG